MSMVYLNGEFLDDSKAMISIQDRGFLFADGIYEVIPVYQNHAFCLHRHLTRLRRSLNEIRLAVDLSDDDLIAIIRRLDAENPGENKNFYIQVTRGFQPVRKHPFPEAVKPTILVKSTPLHVPSKDDIMKGIQCVTKRDIRWQRCDIKSIALLPSILLCQEALDEGAQEAILYNDQNQALEGSHSNLFWVTGNTLCTTPLSANILGGTTRDLILEIAKTHNIATQETFISPQDLLKADEVWLTGATREISPVIAIDGQTISEGKAGPQWHQMWDWFQAHKQEVIKQNPLAA
jgi:D-alanine transaminase